MKNIFLNKVIIIVSALFAIMLLYKVVAIRGQDTNRASASPQKIDNIDVWVQVFEDPERDKWQKPDEVVKSLNLKPGETVADIGAGTGYFTRYFAKAVTPGGMALGLEVDPSMVQYMKEDAHKLELNNYKALLIKPDNPELEPRSMDVVFLCNAYHHIEKRVDYLKHDKDFLPYQYYLEFGL